jgi:hypothetical protein
MTFHGIFAGSWLASIVRSGAECAFSAATRRSLPPSAHFGSRQRTVDAVAVGLVVPGGGRERQTGARGRAVNPSVPQWDSTLRKHVRLSGSCA